MSNKSQNGSGSIVAGAIILGAIIIGLFIYLGLQRNTNNDQQTPAKNITDKINKTSTRTSTTSATTAPNNTFNQDSLSKNRKTENTQQVDTTLTTNNQSSQPTISDEEAIRQELLQKTNIPENKLEFEISVNNGKIARGSVKNKDDQGGAGWFAAKNQNTQNKWKVTYVGQGVPKCTEVNPYNYPTPWADYCLNAQGKTVKR